jgi:hypothetical protein
VSPYSGRSTTSICRAWPITLRPVPPRWSCPENSTFWLWRRQPVEQRGLPVFGLPTSATRTGDVAVISDVEGAIRCGHGRRVCGVSE